ncbi:MULTISPECIES: TetR/AcrR family transcriptional regulator C-terminal domain-containing protein [unclassified Blastococcus]
MAPRTDAPARSALTRRRVLQAAVDLADREGLAALTMRRLAQELGVEAMSLYHHVANKEAVLDGVVEVVIGEIVAAVDGVGPDPAEDWRAALRARVLTARQVLLRHTWAPPVIETRTAMNAEIVGYYDGLLGILRAGGFSYDLAHHAMHALGSRALGFTRELFTPADPETGGQEAMAMLEQLADRYPHLAGMLADTVHEDEGVLGWCDDQAEFEFALDLLLDGLDRRVGHS